MLVSQQGLIQDLCSPAGAATAKLSGTPQVYETAATSAGFVLCSNTEAAQAIIQAQHRVSVLWDSLASRAPFCHHCTAAPQHLPHPPGLCMRRGRGVLLQGGQDLVPLQVRVAAQAVGQALHPGPVRALQPGIQPCPHIRREADSPGRARIGWLALAGLPRALGVGRGLIEVPP